MIYMKKQSDLLKKANKKYYYKKTIMKKELNFLEQARMDDFLKGGAVKKLKATLKSLDDNAEMFQQISGKLQRLTLSLSENVDSINRAVDNGDIEYLESLIATGETLVSIVEEKSFSEDIASLAKTFKIKETSAGKVSKEDLKKSLGM